MARLGRDSAGFRPGEKLALVAAWLLPAVATPVAEHSSLQLAPAVLAWLVVCALFLLAAIRLSAPSLSRIGRRATGALTLLAVAVHLALRGGLAAADPMAWIVNLSLLAGGALLLLPRRRRSAASAQEPQPA